MIEPSIAKDIIVQSSQHPYRLTLIIGRNPQQNTGALMFASEFLYTSGIQKRNWWPYGEL